MSLSANPYLSRGPVRTPDMFYGRLDILREMADFLRGNQSISIVGPRKIGKTSLLYHLMRPAIAQQLGIADRRLFCYLDCEGMGNDSPVVVLQQFAGEMRLELEAQGQPEEPALENACAAPSRLALEAALRTLGKRGFSIVMILDEFERLSANAQLDVNFFNALRSMAGRFPIAFITASATPLIELTFSGRSQEILSSPFFNIFAPLLLRGLAEDEARALIWVPAEKAGRSFPAPWQDALYQYAGGHPFLLQVACFHAFDADTVEAMEMRASQELQSHFEYCWRTLTETQRAMLLAIPNRSFSSAEGTDEGKTLHELEQKGLAIRREGRWTYSSRAWQAFLARQMAPSTGPTITGPIPPAGMRYPGKTIGAYEILEPIGKGGMAEVYKARHVRLDRLAALKILFPHLVPEGDFRQRFEREARVVASLQHPNVIQVYDVGDEDGLYYIAMEYVGGRDLGYRLGQVDRLPLPQAWWIAVDIAAALDFAHAQGIVHRDVKPSNVLLDPFARGGKEAAVSATHQQRAILTDFGIAKMLEQSTQPTQAGLFGTAEYMSPEQISLGAEIDGRADIYALAVMLFRMLTGKLPFPGASPHQVMIAHLEAPPPDARELAPDLPEKVAAALQRAMAKDPGERFATAKEFLSAMK